MDNLPTTRPGETPRARADEFCVHSPRTLELRSIPIPTDHRNPTTSDAWRPSRLPPEPPPPLKLPCEPPADECVSVDDDNIGVSTDASCITDLSWETVSDTGSKTAKAGKKKKKKKKSGAARKKRRKERIDRPPASFEAESAGNVSSDSNPHKEAILDILSSLARRGDLPKLADLGLLTRFGNHQENV